MAAAESDFSQNTSIQGKVFGGDAHFLASDVLQAEDEQLFAWCDTCGISDKNFRVLTDYRLALLERLIERKKGQPAKTIFVSNEKMFKETAEKRQPLQDALHCLRQIRSNSSHNETLQKLKVPKIASWLDEGRCVELRKISSEAKPSLLFAGCTSSGKSTLLNALLGGSYLPVTYNAGTAVVCEIKFSANGEIHARSHMKKGTVEDIDLESDSGRHKFAYYVNHSRKRDTFSITSEQLDDSCVKMELFLPLDFLQHFTLVDSPGVTEDLDSESVIRKATENFQENSACGLVYVLDTTRAPEEAAQAGGLLEKIAATFPTPKAALFVLNKWDLRPNSEKSPYIERLNRKLSGLWRGYKPTQLCTINAKLAFAGQQAGAITDELNEVCEKIKTLVPVGMDALVMRNISPVLQFENAATRTLGYSISQLTDESKTSAESFPTSLRALQLRSRAAQLDIKFKAKLERLTGSLVTSLSEIPGFDRSLNLYQKLCLFAFQEKFKEPCVKDTFGSDIERAVDCQKFRDWLHTEFEPEVETLIREFDVAHKPAPERSDILLTKAVKNVQFSVPHYRIAGALLIFFALFFGLKMGVYFQFALFMALVYLSIKFVQGAVDLHYIKFLHSLCSNGGKELQKVLYERTLSEYPQSALAKLTQWIPCRIHELDDFTIPAAQDPGDLPRLKNALTACQEIKSQLAELILGLQMHEYDENDDKVKLANETQSLESMSLISSGPICKRVTLSSGKKTDCLLGALQSCRSFCHPHLVSFLGSALHSLKPPSISFLFEGFPYGTLAQKICQEEASSLTRGAAFSRKAASIAKQVWSGLAYLHSLGMAHGRLTTEDIMVTSIDSVKINPLHTISLFHEQVPNQQHLDLSADVYNMSLILWEIWHWKMCNSTTNISEQWLDMNDPKLARDWQAFSEQCFNPEIARRPSAEEGYDYFRELEMKGTTWR